MFDPYSSFSTHRRSLGKALIPLPVTGLILFLWGFLCPAWVHAHPGLFVGIGCAAGIIAAGSVPIQYLRLDDRTFRLAGARHDADQLRLILPQELTCAVVSVRWVSEPQAEGCWIRDGREEMFGYAACVNGFRIQAGTELAVISGGDAFLAFVKRDKKTESFYRSGKTDR